MRQKGFTLIELLEVIVILAIIALIATPIILGIIKDSKKETNKRSVDNYAKAVQNALTRYQLTGKKLEINKLETINGREFNNTDFKVEYEGNVVCHTIEIYEDGNIYLGNCVVNGDNVDYTYGIKRYNDGEIVYFDVKEGKGCTKSKYESSLDKTIGDYLNSKTGYNGYTNKDEENVEIEKIDIQNSCLKFYAFLDDDGEKINLLLDHNTTAKIAWNSSDSNKTGPLELKQQLYEDTKGWKRTITPSNYKYNHSSTEREYIIEYSEKLNEGETTSYNARLITAQEVAQITGADKENTLDFKEESSIGWYYFHDYSQDEKTGRGDVCKIDGCKYKWLYDRTYTNCTGYGCSNNALGVTYGYWTSSAHTTYSNYAWIVYRYGYLHFNRVDDINNYGVRPVIEVLNSDLN